MKAISFTLVIICLVALACNKDEFTTIPQFTVKSISPGTVFNGDILSFEGEYRDEEGDIDSALIVYKWYNGAAIVRNDTFRYSITDFALPSDTRKADLSVDFQYNTANPNGLLTLPGASTRDTTATLGIVLIDLKANRSVYAESSPIRLKKP